MHLSGSTAETQNLAFTAVLFRPASLFLLSLKGPPVFPKLRSRREHTAPPEQRGRQRESCPHPGAGSPGILQGHFFLPISRELLKLLNCLSLSQPRPHDILLAILQAFGGNENIWQTSLSMSQFRPFPQDPTDTGTKMGSRQTSPKLWFSGPRTERSGGKCPQLASGPSGRLIPRSQDASVIPGRAPSSALTQPKT